MFFFLWDAFLSPQDHVIRPHLEAITAIQPPDVLLGSVEGTVRVGEVLNIKTNVVPSGTVG